MFHTTSAFLQEKFSQPGDDFHFLAKSCTYHGLRGRRGEPEVRVALDVAEVPVEVCAVRLFESGAEAEVGELDVAARVQQKVVRLDVSAKGG